MNVKSSIVTRGPCRLLPWAGCAAIGRLTEAFAQDTKTGTAAADGDSSPSPIPAFKGKIGETYKDSTPSYPQPVKAAEGQPERAAHPARRRRLRHVLDVRRAGADAAPGQAREERPEVHPVPHHGAVQPDAGRPARRPQSPQLRHRASSSRWAPATPATPASSRRSTALVSQTLRDNGYATGMFGKWHNTPEPEISPAGPFDRWPTGLGFDYFYGFNQGETHQYYPTLYRNTTPVPQPKSPEQGYHFTADMTDEAIAWTRNVRAADRDKPWFVYFSTSGVHAPHHAPKEWRDKYKGKFDHGWDKQRELTHAKQLEMGIIPKGTKLTPRPKEIPAWDDQSADAKKVYTRLMENYAAYMAYTDHQVGRLIDSLQASGELDNTLVMYVVGDNGASAEGGLEGTFSEIASLIGVQLGLESTIKRIDEIGGPTSEPHVPVGWAWAMDAPFQWTKQVASHFGGTRNPMVVHWPKGIKAKGEIADPVPPRHRRRADDPGGVQDPRAEGRQRHPAEADRRRVDALLLRRRERQGPADDAVLRAGHQPGDLPRRLGGVQPLRAAVGDRRPRRRLPQRPVGALQHRGGLQPGRRPRREGAGEAQGAAGQVPGRGEEVRRVPARPAVLRADGPEAPRVRRAEDELDLLRQQRLAAGTDRSAALPARPHHHRRADDPQGRGGGRHHLLRARSRRAGRSTSRTASRSSATRSSTSPT